MIGAVEELYERVLAARELRQIPAAARGKSL